MECTERFIFYLPVIPKCEQVPTFAIVPFTDTGISTLIFRRNRAAAKWGGKSCFGVWKGAYVLLPHPYLYYSFNSGDLLRTNARTGLAFMAIAKANMVHQRPERLWIFVACGLPHLDCYCCRIIPIMQTI